MIQLERAQKIANQVVSRLKPYCKKKADGNTFIELVGSIRRKRPWVNDIDLVLIPRDLWNFHTEVKKLGALKMSGPKIMRVMTGSTQIDCYVADEDTWATLLLIRTGSKENNIRLCLLAQERGWRLAASGDGLFNEHEERIAGDSEQSIYQALDLPYQEPWEREVVKPWR